MSRASETQRAWLVMVLLILLWGYAWITAKIALRYASVLDATAVRLVFGTLFLFAFLLWSKSSLRPEHWKWLIVIGLLQTAGLTLFNNLGLVRGEPGRISMLTFTMPFWVLVIAWPALGERIRGWHWLAIIMALAGLLLIMQPWNLHASLIGKVYAVLGGICWGIGVICAKYLHSRERVDVVNFTCWQTAIATIPIMLAAIIFDTTAIDWNPTFVVCILVVGVGATGLGWVMWLYVLHRLPAGTTSLASLGVPVVAGISSWLQLGERPTALEFTGMLLIAAALALVAWLNIRQRQPSEPIAQD